MTSDVSSRLPASPPETVAPALTVAILARNAVIRVAAAVESVRFADEILVVDGLSTDGTADEARRLGATVVLSDRLGPKNPGGFAAQRNFAMEQSHGAWVLFLDTDERVTPELAEELRQLLLNGSGPPSDVDAYQMRRIEHFWGVRTDHTHGAAWQTRLLRRSACRWDSRRVHEGVVCAGRVASLHGRIWHHSKESIADYVATMNRYTTLEAEQAEADGRALPRRPWRAMVRAFAQVYLYKRGYREGAFGLGMALLFAFYSFLCWYKQWEIQVKTNRVVPIRPDSPCERRAAAFLAKLWRLKSPPNPEMESPEARGEAVVQ